jgi:hypothetical protein
MPVANRNGRGPDARANAVRMGRLAVAAKGSCRLLLSEDLQDGFSWRGVTVANPFAAVRLHCLRPYWARAANRKPAPRSASGW